MRIHMVRFKVKILSREFHVMSNNRVALLNFLQQHVQVYYPGLWEQIL